MENKVNLPPTKVQIVLTGAGWYVFPGGFHTPLNSRPYTTWESLVVACNERNWAVSNKDSLIPAARKQLLY